MTTKSTVNVGDIAKIKLVVNNDIDTRAKSTEIIVNIIE